jgi:UPF0755 protein
MSAKKSRKIIFRSVLLLLALLGGAAVYFGFFKPNVYLDGKKYKFVYVPTRSTYEEMVEMLEEENILQNRKSFEWMARAMNLRDNFKPGKYRVIAGMSNRQLINLIKSGKQELVRITFNSGDHTNTDLINKISDKFEIDEDELESFFEGETEVSRRYGLNGETLRCLFIPETYEMNWNTSLPDFMARITKTYDMFWTAERKQKAKVCRMSEAEVITLASIVQSECSNIESEQRKIAGVYMNRLAKNMPLQADPTVIFAIGDFTKQRVWEKDLDYNSPYNTYENKGLPPGPICLVYPKVIDAVLNYEHHNYLYFCAKPSLNGCSDFSATYDQHCKYAAAYKKEMDKRGVK